MSGILAQEKTRKAKHRAIYPPTTPLLPPYYPLIFLDMVFLRVDLCNKKPLKRGDLGSSSI